MQARAALLAAPAAAVLALAITGCGNQSSPSGSGASGGPTTSPTTAAAHLPACSDVWVAGQKLPGHYAGCVQGGQTIAAAKQSCSSGQVLVTFADAYYAVPNRPVQHVPGLKKSKVYKRMQQACSG